MDMNDYAVEALVKAHIAELRADAARVALLHGLPHTGLLARLRVAVAHLAGRRPPRAPAPVCAAVAASRRAS
jgi:hypothetical protein